MDGVEHVGREEVATCFLSYFQHKWASTESSSVLHELLFLDKAISGLDE